MRTPWRSSTSPAAADSAATSDALSSPSGWSPYSQPRSSRSCRRASDADPPRLVRMPLDQRQRLQHGVVHARRDVRALLAADPRRALGVAVEREPPHPGAGDQQQRARDGAGREQRRGRASARQQRRPRRPPRARCRRRRAAPPAGSCRPGATRARARPRSGRSRATDRSESPSALEQEPARDDGQDRREPHVRPPASRPRARGRGRSPRRRRVRAARRRAGRG